MSSLTLRSFFKMKCAKMSYNSKNREIKYQTFIFLKQITKFIANRYVKNYYKNYLCGSFTFGNDIIIS